MPNETIDVFCAREQAETPHSLEVDGAGELILTCLSAQEVQEGEEPKTCGRFLKFPAGTTSDQLKEYVASHKTANVGQVTLESQEQRRKEILEGFNKE